MFLGEYSHTIDQKGRVAIPVRFRRELGEGAVITRGADQCLVVYPKAEWHELASKLAALPISDARARSFARLTLAGAAEIEFDKQGRALVPAYLKEHAGLTDQVVVTGVMNRIEVWGPTAWSAYKAAHSVDENLSEFGV